MRNHNTLKRDTVIKQVASIVGPGHSVDLKNPDLTILVDIVKVRRQPSCDGYHLTSQQNICSVTVVGPDYEKLKRYNLQEIFEPNAQKAEP